MTTTLTGSTKVWRYFDQTKAEHFVKTSKIYLRRLDLLTSFFEGDPYEGNPTFSLIEIDLNAHQNAFGHADENEIKQQYRDEQKATFVSCWQMSDCESWLMWKQYCNKGGGFAVQTDVKRLSVLAGKKSLLLKPVEYLDHYLDLSLREHTVPIQVFIKPRWFTDEKEIRLARFRGDCICGTNEQKEAALAGLNDHELIETNLSDLIEKIVWNPFSSDFQKKEVWNLINTLHPELKSRVFDSEISCEPVLTRKMY